jgi:hypothetical protein
LVTGGIVASAIAFLGTRSYDVARAGKSPLNFRLAGRLNEEDGPEQKEDEK